MFRGVLARGFATRLPLPFAVLASAALFSAYHMSPVQALPTFVLGAMLAVVAIRGGSIVPTMLAHAINNAIAIVATRSAGGGMLAWLDDHAYARPRARCIAGVGLALELPR